MAGFCQLCGRSLAGVQTSGCPGCSALYFEDIAKGIVPEGLVPFRSFTYSDWIAIRCYERDAERDGVPQETIRKNVREYVAQRKEAYEDSLARSRAKEQEMATFKDRMRSRYSY